MTAPGSIEGLVARVLARPEAKKLGADHVESAIRGSLDPDLLVDNLAELLRLTPGAVEELLGEAGFGGLVSARLLEQGEAGGETVPFVLAPGAAARPDAEVPGGLFSVAFTPPPGEPARVPPALADALSMVERALVEQSGRDPFLGYYRQGVAAYHDEFVAGDGARIRRYVEESFGAAGPRYLVNSGIGANEQFNHFPAWLHNERLGGRPRWLVLTSPKQLARLPADATVENTLFMEFSRSGKTEETVKLHEYTPRAARRVVFANKGPLRALGERDGNLVLELPDEVPGRFGRNLTPILLAPMLVAGLDTAAYWRRVEEAIAAFDLESPHALPVLMARFVYLFARRGGVNQIYLGCDHEPLGMLADELIQFWNEGVNKGGNDLLISRYMGLPRDAHTVVEGLLGNAGSKMALFLMKRGGRRAARSSLVDDEIDPIDPDHRGLRRGDEETVLTEANYRRFSELMPTLGIVVDGDLGLGHSAVLGQLWADFTYAYSRLMNVDPGSNPEVKAVRDRAAQLLAEAAAARRAAAEG